MYIFEICVLCPENVELVEAKQIASPTWPLPAAANAAANAEAEKKRQQTKCRGSRIPKSLRSALSSQQWSTFGFAQLWQTTLPTYCSRECIIAVPEARVVAPEDVGAALPAVPGAEVLLMALTWRRSAACAKHKPSWRPPAQKVALNPCVLTLLKGWFG